MTKITLVSPVGRTADADWNRAHSWYGGSPRMTSDVSWPCNDQGQPLHFLAQLDLSKLPNASASSYLPRDGHLAFFADTEFDQPHKARRHEKFDEYCWPCAVVYLQEISGSETPVPTNLAPLFGSSWSYYFRGHDSRNPPVRFGRIAVDFQVFETNPARFSEDLKALLQAQKTFAPFAPRFEVPSKPEQILWRTVLKIANDIERAISSRRDYLENFGKTAANSRESLKQLVSSQPLFEKFIAKWKERSAKNDKNSEIGLEIGENLITELEELKEIFTQIGIRANYVDEYRRRPGSGDHMDIPDYWFHGRATRDAYEEMVTGNDADFEAIPEGIRHGLWRNLGNTTYSPESHDMICGIDANAGINPLGNRILEDAELLLELNSSFLWTWGDMGRLQFWIESTDAENQDWRKVFLLLRSS